MKINLNLKLAIFFGFLFIFGIVFGWFGFPKLLQAIIKQQKTLKPGSEFRSTWAKVPFPIDFRVWVFNVTNANDVTQGAKPILKEVGPFVFEEWKDKYNLKDNDEDDTVSFHMRNTFFLRSDKGLSGEEIITMPHPLMMFIPIMVKRASAPIAKMIKDKLMKIVESMSPPLIYLTSVLAKRQQKVMIGVLAEALKEMFHSTEPFINVKFIDMFYNGIPVDCSSDLFAVKIICAQFSAGKIKGGFSFNSTHYGFSFLGTANGTSAGKFTVFRGVKNYASIGKVKRFKNKQNLDVWEDESECNEFRGTDATIFPPLLSKEDKLWSFSADLCRSISPSYHSKSSYSGLPTVKYEMDFGDLKNEPENHCFCSEEPYGCPLKGTMSLQRCVNVPMIVSLPHFYKSDESLLKQIIGLSPNPAKHEMIYEFEMLSGTPMLAVNRLQFNFDIEPIEEYDPMKKIKKMVLPVFWVEETVKLNKTFVDLLENTIFLAIKLNNITRETFLLVGSMGLCITMYLHYSNRKKLIDSNIVEVKEVNDNSENDSAIVKDIHDKGDNDSALGKSTENILKY